MFHADYSAGVFTHITLCLVFFSSGLSLLIAIEQLNRVKRFPLNYGKSAAFFCNAVVLANLGMIISGVCLQYPFLIFPLPTILCILGPLQIYHNLGLFKPLASFTAKEKIQLLPAGIVFISETLFHLQSLEYKRAFLKQAFAENGRFWGKGIILVITLYFLGYMCYLLYREIEIVRENKTLAKKVSMMVRVHSLYIISIFFIGAGLAGGYGFLVNAGAVLASLIVIFVLLFYSKEPELFQVVVNESHKKRYERSVLKGINRNVVNNRLMELMENERIYTDFEANLTSVAELLALTPQQLSQFLNENVEQDFRNFINTYRVEDAKLQLLENSDKKILTICFDVGFSSKSAFFSAFKKNVGMTPNEYRQANRKK